MFTPDPQINPITAHTRSKRRRPTKGLATLTLAGSLSVALAATLASTTGASQAAEFAAPVAASTPNPHLPSLHEEAERKCSPRNFFRFHGFHPINFFVPRTHFIDGPGGSVTASVRRQHRVYFEVEIEREKGSEIDKLHTTSTTRTNGTTTSTTAGTTTNSTANETANGIVDTKALLRRLRNNVNPLLAEELIVETGHEYTQEISDGMYGNLWYRVFGYRVGFSSWHQLSDCSSHVVATGVASVPARVEGWRYWETKHPIYKGHQLSPK
ncbi:hypothetical protein ACQPYK_46650 [Streptosporangium sp. CA-135522]|uniref:hypothetical protein n=1 Tax=Streptosporangium sp. CA-135522 TaxID=3240072 RepID=UPI003D8A8FE1